jgi:hypothetical protein
MASPRKVYDLDLGWYRQAGSWGLNLSWNPVMGILYTFTTDPSDKALRYEPIAFVAEVIARQIGEHWEAEGPTVLTARGLA